jgi:hypothetical protein
MRLIIYGTLVTLVTILLIDTNLGNSLGQERNRDVARTVRHIEQAEGLAADHELASSIEAAGGFRQSFVYAVIVKIGEKRNSDLSFYAYTPMFSHSRVFLGDSFWDLGSVGQSSILLHEMSHIRRHARRPLGGFPRGEDEAEAYKRQYDTYRLVDLSPVHDGIVFWDMMIGVQTYVLPRYPQYAKRSDILWALKQLTEEADNG